MAAVVVCMAGAVVGLHCIPVSGILHTSTTGLCVIHKILGGIEMEIVKLHDLDTVTPNGKWSFEVEITNSGCVYVCITDQKGDNMARYHLSVDTNHMVWDCELPKYVQKIAQKLANLAHGMRDQYMDAFKTEEAGETEEMTHLETEEDAFPALETSLEVELRLDLEYWQQEYEKCQKSGITQLVSFCIRRINELYDELIRYGYYKPPVVIHNPA